MRYNLGLDMGIASVGIAAIHSDTYQILMAATRIFEAAEEPKTGASLALPRRVARGGRRVIGRRRKRKSDIRQMLAQQFTMERAQINAIIDAPQTSSVWALRAEGIDRALTPEEWGRVLFHIAKRRGFQSNRKDAQPNDVEGKKALSAAKALEEAMLAANAPTIGAYLATQAKQRNGDGCYEHFVTRDRLREEVNLLFAKQRAFQNPYADTDFEARYTHGAFYQRPLASVADKVGMCGFFPDEPRAPKCSYSAELFVLWSRLNNIKIITNGIQRTLTLDEMRLLAEKAHQSKEVTYKQARKALCMDEESRFNLSYRQTDKGDTTWKSVRDAAEKAIIAKLNGYHALKEAMDSGSVIDWHAWCDGKRTTLDEIARILSFYPDAAQQEAMLMPLGVTQAQCTKLMNITNFSKTVDVSLKAIAMLLTHMQEGMRYDQACVAAGMHHSTRSKGAMQRVPIFEDVRNPVVNRALAQARKVINAVIAQYGLPECIIVELAREVGKNRDDRKKIEIEQKKNAAMREASKKEIAEIYGVRVEDIRGDDVLKHRLWKEQQGFCPYSWQEITPQMLRDAHATQIDHIIPYSRSFDDSYMNKVLCIASQNQAKQNKTPYEYLDDRRFAALQAFAQRLPKAKGDRLISTTVDEEGWKTRALNDTRYMARLLKNHLETSLPVKVQTRNGALTAKLRHLWGFPEKDRTTDRHHALDAIVLACSTQSMVQQVAQEYKAQRSVERKPIPKPYPTFREDAWQYVYGTEGQGGIFVSRMPNRKVTGAAHQDTIRSIRHDAEGNQKIVQRVKLASVKLAHLEAMVDKERNRALYDVLKARLEAHGDDPKKAFATPIFMPTRDGKPAPRIHGIRIITNEKSGIPINGGLASNGDMARVDVFRKAGKYFLVPIYVHHLAGDALPNKAILAGKPETQWETMRDEDFIFSLYKNDLVRIRRKSEEILGYYNGTDISSASIELVMHDKGNFLPDKKGKNKKNPWRGIGVKTLLGFEKYTVDVLGNISKEPVAKEVRCGVVHSDDSESSEIAPE
ncbi:MAG: type II CRISPR RNA-guided endonuclease Cas9 [Alphaproteobacteria bacterium]|nr:MAG: type II CRISPR RNA-guided endonuclease Cas9 [Alphaproteobacteria bacterium]TAF14412.1 MAG: type II CRISPR RNA-guided endonuclease Cas9 [Alphaproteobacteria bacterium]TAF39573.1 MAG: type II CRISPR RNA-guided endonuclease Cas9 [Alphaproteobacteria bacterium]TAF77556.1 MAG: type II CRISPR RNA-guided endonuclease Cas9 [Alphaproteobacteria bacterium]